jgi:Glycosyl hydrolase family 26
VLSKKRIPRRAWVAIACFIVLCQLTLIANAGAKQRPAKPLYWGAQVGRQFTGIQAPWDMNALSAFEATVGKNVSLLAFYSPFADCNRSPCEFFGFPGVPMEHIRRHGAIPFFSWSSSAATRDDVRQPAFQLRDVLAGTYDPFIESFAENAREWGHPFFLRFDWEMNGFWFPWGDGINGNKNGEFVAVWRHVHDIFTRLGANNATWVWCPNIALAKRLQNLRKFWPGAAYVDWTCLDGFNWGTTAHSPGWLSFDEIFRSTYKRVLKIAPHKPMAIGETASEERGGSKAKWIRNALNVLPARYPKARALIWFDEMKQARHWPIGSSKAAQAAFNKAISRPLFMANYYSGQPAGKILPPTWTPPPAEATPAVAEAP